MWRTLLLFTATIPALLLLGMMVAQLPLVPLWAAAFLVVPFVIWLVKSPQTLFLFWLVASPLLHEYLNISGGGIPNITLDRVVLPSLALRVIFGISRAPGVASTWRNKLPILLCALYAAGELAAYLHGAWPLTSSIQLFLDRVLLPLFAFWIAWQLAHAEHGNFAHSIILSLFWIGIISFGLEGTAPLCRG